MHFIKVGVFIVIRINIYVDLSQEKSNHKFTDVYKVPESEQVIQINTELENDKHTELNDSPREYQQNATHNDLNIKRKRMRKKASDVPKGTYLNDSVYPDTDMPVMNSLREPNIEEFKAYVLV
jgi:hypothetical protein